MNFTVIMFIYHCLGVFNKQKEWGVFYDETYNLPYYYNYSTEESVWETAAKLGLDKSRAKFGSVDTTYAHYYGIEPDVFNLETPEVTFDIAPPEWVK